VRSDARVVERCELLAPPHRYSRRRRGRSRRERPAALERTRATATSGPNGRASGDDHRHLGSGRPITQTAHSASGWPGGTATPFRSRAIVAARPRVVQRWLGTDAQRRWRPPGWARCTGPVR
jgi:hypothetical protein